METIQPRDDFGRGTQRIIYEMEVHTMSFASTLQTLRKEAGLTQEQLASKFGVSAQAVSKWENGSFPEGDLIHKGRGCTDAVA